jgi:hypothetical protein
VDVMQWRGSRLRGIGTVGALRMYESTCREDEGCPTPFYFACASEIRVDRDRQNGAACEDSLHTSNNMNIKNLLFCE